MTCLDCHVRALELPHPSSQAWEHLGCLLGGKTQAIRIFDRLRILDTDDEMLATQEFCFHCAILIDRSNAHAWNYLGKIVLGTTRIMDETLDALACLVRAVELQPENATFMNDLVVRMNVGDSILIHGSPFTRLPPFPAPSTAWSNNLCTFDCWMCMSATICPYCAVASLRSKYDRSSCFCNWLCTATYPSCLLPCVVRNIIRHGYNIPGSCCDDLCITLWCFPCSYIQMAKEVETSERQALRSRISIANARPWKTDLCSCKCGCPCLYAYMLPSCALASARSDFDGSNCCFNVCCMTSPGMYSTIRAGYGIPGDGCSDWWQVMCLSCCSAHQAQREVMLRGNMAQQHTVAAMTKQDEHRKLQ